jgi:hypothetical protein
VVRLVVVWKRPIVPLRPSLVEGHWEFRQNSGTREIAGGNPGPCSRRASQSCNNSPQTRAGRAEHGRGQHRLCPVGRPLHPARSGPAGDPLRHEIRPERPAPAAGRAAPLGRILINCRFDRLSKAHQRADIFLRREAPITMVTIGRSIMSSARGRIAIIEPRCCRPTSEPSSLPRWFVDAASG